MTETRPPKSWVAVASADHVAIGRAAGFMQVNHGKSAPLRRTQAGDRVIYYAPLQAYRGTDRMQAFVAQDEGAGACFAPQGRGKWLADLPGLARRRLLAAGVTGIHGGGLCSFSDPERFFSHRRDRVTGRMAALVWRSPLAASFSRAAPRG